MEDKLFVRLENVSKSYILGHASGVQQLKTAINQDKSVKQNEAVLALQDISFEILEGERVGIIGYNGAGKTTLLSIIGGFVSQSAGTVKVNGKVNAIMSLGVGLREELTGIENIYIGGELHGKTKEEIDSKLEEIIEFADIGEYISKPMRTYSSGMKARLSFSMLSFIEPEILIIDEVLGVGDADFAVKSAKKVQELCEKGKILIVVSHSMGTILNMTDRAIWLDEGRVKLDGDSKTVTAAFSQEVNRRKEENELKNRFAYRMDMEEATLKADIIKFKLLSDQYIEKTIFEVHDRVIVDALIEAKQTLDNWDVKLSIFKMDGTLMMQNYLSEDIDIIPKVVQGNKLEVQTDLGSVSLSEGVYEIKYEVIDSDSRDVLGQKITVIKLENSTQYAMSKPDYYCKYSIEKE